MVCSCMEMGPEAPAALKMCRAGRFSHLGLPYQTALGRHSALSEYHRWKWAGAPVEIGYGRPYVLQQIGSDNPTMLPGSQETEVPACRGCRLVSPRDLAGSERFKSGHGTRSSGPSAGVGAVRGAHPCKQHTALVDTQALPDAIAEQEAGIQG